MRRLRLLPLVLLLPATAGAQYVDTTGSAAVQGLRYQVALTGTYFLPRNTPWRSDSLTSEARSFGPGTIGAEFLLRRTPTWLFGISVGTTRVYTDAIHVRRSVTIDNSSWTLYGERMGLDQRFTYGGFLAAYEPWQYPRRRKVGMTVQLGGGLYYMHLAEQRYVIVDGQADANNYYSRVFYSYATHDGAEELGSSSGHSIAAQLWLRPELHLGRRVSLFMDLGAVFATPFNAEGSTYTPAQGPALTIFPRSVYLHRIMLRTGLAVYF